MKKVIRLDEAAERLGVSVRTVRRLINDGRLGGVKIRIKSLRVLQEDLDQYLQDEILRFQLENGVTGRDKWDR